MAWTTPGTAVAGAVLTAAFWNTQVRDQFIEIDDFFAAWTSWTPSSRTGVTIGNGTEAGRYIKIGRAVYFVYQFTLGSTSAITGNFSVALPFNNQREFACDAYFNDFGTLTYGGIGSVANNSLFAYSVNTAGTYASQANLSSTIPFTWVTNDKIVISGFYEATS